MKIKKGDMVVVISGDEAAASPKRVSQVLEGGMKVVVEGVNVVQRHVKKGHPKSPQGGRVTIPVSIDVTNLALHCPSCNRGVRVQTQVIDGAKRRVCGKCKKSL